VDDNPRVLHVKLDLVVDSPWLVVSRKLHLPAKIKMMAELESQFQSVQKLIRKKTTTTTDLMAA